MQLKDRPLNYAHFSSASVGLFLMFFNESSKYINLSLKVGVDALP